MFSLINSSRRGRGVGCHPWVSNPCSHGKGEREVFGSGLPCAERRLQGLILSWKLLSVSRVQAASGVGSASH